MTLWDGMTSANAAGIPSRIVVLGATNRIHDIDEAILRRMPKKFPVPLPGLAQRRRILQLVLGEARLDADFDLEYVATLADGMSGSDLKELCRDAAMMPMREYLRAHRASGQPVSTTDPANIRGIRTEDFFSRIDATAAAAIASTLMQQTQAQAQAQSKAQTAADEMASRRRAYRPNSGHASSSKRSSRPPGRSSKDKSTGSRTGVDNNSNEKDNDDEDVYEDVEEEPEKATAAPRA